MFETLEEQINRTEATHQSHKEKILRWAAVAVITAAIFGSIIAAVRLFG